MNEKHMTIQLTKVYGRMRVYPACEASEIFTKLTRRTTLSKAALRQIEQLGYTVNDERGGRADYSEVD